MKKKHKISTPLCPCDSGHTLIECCGRYHLGVPAPDAQSLMRSRYSAYALGLENYVLATWHASTRPATLNLAEDAIKWIGLSVKTWQEVGDTASVTFTARYKVGGKAGRMGEISRFVRENACWFYIDGEILEE